MPGGPFTKADLLASYVEQSLRIWDRYEGMSAREFLEPLLLDPVQEFWERVGKDWEGGRVVGDPHMPGPFMATELWRGERHVVWKPCPGRLVPERALQEMVALLPGSGLRPVAIRSAWQGVEADYIAPKDRTPEDLKRRCKALACLLVLVGCFGVSDLHSENVLFDGEDLFVVDGETFGVTGAWTPADSSEAQGVMNRFVAASAHMMLETEGPLREVAQGVLEHLDEAVVRVRGVWPQLVQVRQEASGGHARALRRASLDYAQLMAYSLQPEWRAKVSELLNGFSHHGSKESAAAVLEDLAHGAIPRYEEPIPDSGWARPEVVGAVVRAWLQGGESSRDLAVGPDPGEIHGLGEFIDAIGVEGSGGPFFVTCNRTGLDGPQLDRPDAFGGLLGISLLQWGKKACDLSTDLGDDDLRAIDRAILRGARDQGPRALGLLDGHGGAFLFARARRDLGQPFVELEEMLQASVLLNPEFLLARPDDLFGGLPGLCWAASLSHETLPADALLRRALPHLEKEARSSIAAMQSGEAVALGLGHGLAGLALSIHAAGGVLGVESPVLPPLLEAVRAGLGPDSVLDGELDFCRGRGGMVAALARMGPKGFNDLSIPSTVGDLHHLGCRPRSGDFCHGSAAVAAGLGFWPETRDEDEDPAFAPSAAGMLCGRCGEAYGTLAWRHGLPNPIWGGRMGDRPL